MVKKTACLALLLFSVANPWAYAKVRLKTAVDRALEMSREVLDQRLGTEAAHLRKERAVSRRGFTLDLGGSLAYASDSPHLRLDEVPLLMDALADEDIPPGYHLFTAPRTIYDARLSLAMPISAGGAVRLAAEAEDAAWLAEMDMQSVLESQVAARVKNDLIGYRILRQAKESAELFRLSLEQHLLKAERLFEAELIRKTDIVETRSRIEEARLSAQELDGMIEESSVRFRGLCGFSPDEVEADPEESPPDPETAISLVRTSHPLLRYFEKRLAQADTLCTLAERSGKPQVSGFAQLHFGRPGVNFLTASSGLFVLGGLNIEIPLLDAGKKRAETALAEIERGKLKNRRDEFLRRSEEEIRRFYALKSALEARSATIARMVELAEEDVRLKTRQYEEHQIPNLDCLAAMAQLDKCRTMKTEAELRIEAVKVQIHAFIAAGRETP